MTLDPYLEPVMTLTIPPAETTDRATFDNTVIGTLSREDGGFSCLACCPVEKQDDPCKVYGVNVAPYSVVCHRCGVLVVDGCKMAKDDVTPLCLYDPPDSDDGVMDESRQRLAD